MISLVLEVSGYGVETDVSDGQRRGRRMLRMPQSELRDDGGWKPGESHEIYFWILETF